MNLRHAAALALVGWYLMMPPWTTSWFSTTKRRNDSAPISQWETLRSFDSAELCEQFRGADDDTWQDMVLRWGKEEPLLKASGVKDWTKTVNEVKESMDHSRCIASDDPRLKEK